MATRRKKKKKGPLSDREQKRVDEALAFGPKGSTKRKVLGFFGIAPGKKKKKKKRNG